MGKRGPQTRHAPGTISGWAGDERQPEISAEALSGCLGREVPTEVWQDIRDAFRRASHRKQMMDQLPRLNDNPKDPASYHVNLGKLERALERVVKDLGKFDRTFLGAVGDAAEASMYRQFGRLPEEGLPSDMVPHIAKMREACMQALLVTREASEPLGAAVLTKAGIERQLARDVAAALAKMGIKSTSSGSRDQALERPLTVADFDLLERALYFLGVRENDDPAPYPRWLRRALGENNSGNRD